MEDAMIDPAFTLEKKIAIVVGAANGIGRATALAFAASGAKVACADVEEPGAKTTAAEIEAGGGEGARRRPRGARHPRQHDLAGRDRDSKNAATLEGHGRGTEDDGAQAPARPARPAHRDRARRRLPGERRLGLHD